MRLVLDSNVVVSAVLGSSAPTRLIELAAEGAFDLFTSQALLAELAEVLGRQSISRRLESKHRSASEVFDRTRRLPSASFQLRSRRQQRIPTMMRCLAARLPQARTLSFRVTSGYAT